MTGPLMFVGHCDRCGTETEPVPVDAEGETWDTATKWVFLTLQAHRPRCLGRPAAGGQPSLFTPAGPGPS